MSISLSQLPEELVLQLFSHMTLPELHVVCCLDWTCYRIGKDRTLEWEEKFLAMAQTEMDMQAYHKAIVILNHLLVLYPKCSTGYKQRGLCWDHEDETERAIADYKSAVDLASDASQHHRYQSYLHLATKNYAEAFAEVNQALSLNPREPANFHQHAYVLFKYSRSLGRSSQRQEMEDYQNVLKLGYNRLTVIYNNIGYVHYERGQFAEALRNFDRAIAICPYHVRAYYNRSTVWEQLQDWPKAIADYDAILNINPEVSEAYYFRSKCHAYSDKEAALRDCLLSLTSNPAHVPSLCQLYELMLAAGKLDQLGAHLDEFKAQCQEVHGLLKYMLENENRDETELISRFPKHKRVIRQGKTKQEKELEKYSKVLYYHHLLRGQLHLVRADFKEAGENFVDMKRFASANNPAEPLDTFYTQVLDALKDFDVEGEGIREETKRHCKAMIENCLSKQSLELYVRSLEGGRDGLLPTAADQIFFVACYVFRRLHLQHRGYDNNIVDQFWKTLKKSDKSYQGLQLACSDPVVLTTLFKGFVSAQLEFTTSFVDSFQTLLESCQDLKNRSDGLDNFFLECRKMTTPPPAERINIEGQ